MTNSDKDLIVEYVFIIEVLSKKKYIKDNGDRTYELKCEYKTINNVLNSSKYEYKNNFNAIENLNDIENYINQNDVIIYYINDDITKYLYDRLIHNVYNNIQDLNYDLKLSEVDYNNINEIIQEHIDEAINNIISKIIINRTTKRYYFYLKYNPSTYYPYIEDIKNYIYNQIQNKLNITLHND